MTYTAGLILSKVYEGETAFSEHTDDLVYCAHNVSVNTGAADSLNAQVLPLIFTLADCWHIHEERAQNASLTWYLSPSRVCSSCGGSDIEAAAGWARGKEWW